VGGHRAQVGVELVERDRRVSGAGARVDVHERARVAQCPTDVGSGLTRTHLVVRELHGHERGVGAYRRDHLVGVEASEPVGTDGRHVGVAASECVVNARVFDRGRDDVRATVERRERAPNRGVDRFGTGRCELDFARPGAEEAGDVLARRFERDARRTSLAVQSARVPELALEEREHRLARGRPKGRRGRVVEIGAQAQRQTRVTQCASPPGRLSSIVGCVSPYRPSSMPLTMPVSTAHMMCGYWRAAVAERTVFGNQVNALPRDSAWAAKPCAVNASATLATAALTERCPSEGSMRAAIARPYSRPTSSAMLRASSIGKRSRARASNVASRSSRRGGNESCASSAVTAVTLRGPAGRRVTRELDREVPARRELLEMVARNIGMQVEPLSHLGGLDAWGDERTKR
jgi:hypothetical protein